MPLPNHGIHCFCVDCQEHHKKTDEPMIEFCVMCNGPTPYLKTTPIDERENYIEGCGQLCKSCAEKI